MMRMMPLRFSIVAAVAVVLLATPAAASTKVERVVSPGGIEAWLVQDATLPLISIQFAFKGGSAQDPSGKPGVASLMGDMLDEGAGDLDSKAFHERLERRAIEFNMSVNRDHVRGSLRMLKDNSGEAFELLRLAVTSPRFDAEPLERVRAQTMSLLRRESVTPGSIATQKFWAVAYQDHPYAQPTNGTLDSVPTITADDLKSYVARTFAKDGLKIAVVGDIDGDALGKLLDQTFGGLPARGDLVPIAKVDFARPAQRVAIPLDVPQTNILFGGPGVRRDDPDFMPAYVVSHILGGGALSSRLYHEVREKRGLVYSVSESLLWMSDTGLFVGSTATRADKANETADVIAQELKRMADNGPSQQELDEAKAYLKGSQMLALDSSTKFAGALVQYQIDNRDIDYIEKRNSFIDAVTLDDAKRVAKRIWSKAPLMISVGRPVEAPSPAKN